MPRVFTRRIAAGALIATAAASGATGAAIYAAATSPTTKVVTSTPSAAASSVARSVASGLTVKQIYARNASGVVEVDVTTTAADNGPFGGSSTKQAQGTGFVYDKSGHIVTNEHVVENASAITVTFSDGSTDKATLVGSDASSDLAVLKVEVPAARLNPLTLADSSAVSVGDEVVAIGNPFGLDNTVTAGIVSAVGREITAPDSSPIENAIQTDAAINHGNSGGPLFDMQGNVVGVTAQIESDSGGNDGVGFAIPSNTVTSVVSQLISTGSAKHALLGVEVQMIPSSVAATLGVSSGVAIATVESGSAAAKAGLRASTGTKTVAGRSYPTGGDVITAFDGISVTSAPQLRGLVDALQPGEKARLTVVRGGTSRTVTVVLGTRTSA
jgi:S1-C subfamily serine protease